MGFHDIMDNKHSHPEQQQTHGMLLQKVKELTAGLNQARLELREEAARNKLTELTLKESEERYRSLFENSIEAVFAVDLEGNFTAVNNAMAEITGFSQKELVGQNYKKIVSEETAPYVFKVYNKVFKTKKSVSNIEYELIRNDGTQRMVEGSVNIIKKGDRAQGFQGNFRDITKRRMAEKNLRFQAMLLSQIKDSIVATDLKGRIQFANKAAVNFLGYPVDKLIGQDLESLGKDKGFEIRQKQIIKQTLANGQWLGNIISFGSKENQISLDTRCWILLDTAGKPEGVCGVSTNSTELKHAEKERLKLEEKLRQAQKMESIGTLASGIAHDFNNILFPIIGYTEMTLDLVPKGSIAQENLNKVIGGALRAKNLVQQILTFSRQHNQELKPLQVELIIKEALKLLRSSLPTTIEIRQKIKKDCGLVMADPTQMHQIIMNLCTNAFHAMEKTGGILEVSLEKVELAAADLIDPQMMPGSYLCFKVSDSGPGIEPAIQKRIFDPYFTTKKDGKGTGLGLAMVHGIVKNSKGKISVYSEPGKGTVFSVCLPRIKNDSISAKPVSHDSLPTGNEHILLVDDEEMIASMEKQMIEKFGYQVTTLTSSIEALEAFTAQPDKFDLVITDMTMPNITGDQLAVALIKIRPDIPIIICTGFSEIISEQRATEFGIKGFLTKPIIMKKLAETIRDVLDN